MKSFDLGRTISILANIGVIAGIIFLAVEIRQNNRSAKASSYVELTNQIIESNDRVLVGPELVMASDSRETFLQLSASEQQQLRSNTIILMRYGDLAFYQRQLGLLDDERFTSLMRPVTNRVCNWVFQDVWTTMKSNFVPDYEIHIDSQIAQC